MDASKIGNHWDVEFAPYNDSVVYSSTSTQVFYSTSGGRSGTWQISTLSPAITGNPARIDLGVRDNRANSQSTAVYALVSQAGNGTFGGIYQSLDYAQNFTRQTNSPNILGTATDGTGSSSLGRYGNSITVDPANFSRIATGSLCMWRSDGANGGTTMVYSSTFREGLDQLPLMHIPIFMTSDIIRLMVSFILATTAVCIAAMMTALHGQIFPPVCWPPKFIAWL